MIGLDDRPSRKDGVTSTRAGDEAVLVLPSKGQIKVLNEVGARVWDLMDGSLPVRQIVALLCAEFEVEAEQAEQDTLLFLSEMVHKGLLDVEAAPASGHS